MNIYIVKQGDTIYNIAKRFKTSPERIAIDNGLKNPSHDNKKFPC